VSGGQTRLTAPGGEGYTLLQAAFFLFILCPLWEIIIPGGTESIMIWIITKRELLSNIITFRFLVGLSLCLVLITASTFVLTKDYKVRLESYSENVSKHEDELKNYRVHYQISVSVDKPPAPLGFLCIGSDKELGNMVEGVSYREVPMSAAGQGGNNPLMGVFLRLDMALIIQVVLSLLVLSLSYDAISGERERKTLALMLSNPLPRYHVLLGKLIGGMITIAIPLAVGMLFSLLVVLGSGFIILSISEWARIWLVFISSLLYLSVIFMMGMFVSARARSSATSLLILLFIWVFLVMLLPNMGPYVARHLRKVENKAVLGTKIWALVDEFNTKASDYGIPLWEAGKYPPDLWRFMRGEVRHDGHPYPKIVQYAPRENMIWFLEGLKGCLPMHLEYANKIWEVYSSYERELRRQATLSDSISRISPAWVYYNATSILAGTDVNAYMRFMDQARQYRQQLIDYSRAKKGFSTLSFFTTMKMDETLPFAQLLKMEEKQGAEAVKKFIESSIEKNWTNGQPLMGIPIFRYQPESPSESIKRAFSDLLILFMLNIIFFLAAYASFMRQDVK
jgi:ABC-type transport system involved in multi-copper enzyme maturation permease subunit